MVRMAKLPSSVFVIDAEWTKANPREAMMMLASMTWDEITLDQNRTESALISPLVTALLPSLRREGIGELTHDYIDVNFGLNLKYEDGETYDDFIITFSRDRWPREVGYFYQIVDHQNNPSWDQMGRIDHVARIYREEFVPRVRQARSELNLRTTDF